MLISQQTLAKNNELTLKIALPTKKIILDPAKFEDMYSMTIVNQIYAKLFTYRPDSQIIPDLVETWVESDDKRTYTFNLKKRNFSNGTPITAANVEFSLKRLFLKGASLASDLSLIEGAKAFRKTKNVGALSIKSIGNRTLQIVTEQPTPLLIYLLAVPDAGILALDSADQFSEFDRTIVTSGVYKVEEIKPNQILLEKFSASSLDSKNPPAQIVFNLFDEIKPAELASGKISDTSSFMTYDQEKNPLTKEAGWREVPSEASNERFIVLNPEKISFEVRSWLATNINSTDLVKEIGDSSVQPAFGYIPNCLPGHLKSAIVSKKKTLKLKKRINLLVTYGENLPHSKKFESYLAKVWAHPMIKLKFEPLKVNDYLKKLFGKEGEIIIGARGLDYPEGYSTVSYFRSNIDANYFHVNDKNVDALLDGASHEFDDSKRYRAYEQIQLAVSKLATVVPLAFGSWKKYFWSNRVAEVPPHPIGTHFIPLQMLEMAHNEKP